jgi:predicted CopG family antitoxin
MHIEITDSVYDRLSKLAEGFETPNDVIERLLEKNVKSESVSAPSIYYFPTSQNEFKKAFLNNKSAYRTFVYTDNSTKTSQWNAENFSPSSNLEGNIRSGVLRNWKKKNIKALILSIEPIASDKPTIEGILSKQSHKLANMSTRAKAKQWLKERYPNIKDFKASKLLEDGQRWFFTFNAEKLNSTSNEENVLLLECPKNPDSFLILRLPKDFFRQTSDEFKIRNQNNNPVFDLHISAHQTSFLKTRAEKPLNLSSYMVD